MITVFVYGTLMREKRNHHYLANQKFLGIASLNGYDMYDVSTYPGIVRGEGVVLGEAYEVDTESLKKLDKLEGEGLLYKRELENILITDAQGCSYDKNAFVYIWLGDKRGKKVEIMPWKSQGQ